MIVETLYRSSGVFTEEDLLSYDLGRASILGSLETQHVFANLDVSSEAFRFAVVSSTLATPRDLIEVYDVPANAAEIILCSDGYSRAHRTLDDAEADHARLIAVDPHRIFENPGTKGVAEGASSFDDRSYLRVALTRRN